MRKSRSQKSRPQLPRAAGVMILACLAFDTPALAQKTVSLDDKLRMSRPADISEEVSNPVITKGLRMAWENDDLKVLMSNAQLDGCRPESLNPDRTRLDWSTFAGACMHQANQAHFTRFDANFVREPHYYGLTRYPFTRALKFSDVSKQAATRLVSRAASRAASSNLLLKALVEGRFSFNFSLTELLDPAKAAPPPDVRPLYVLKVVHYEPRPKAIKVASLGVTSSDAALAKSGNLQGGRFGVGSRQIVEEWSALSGQKTAPAADAIPKTLKVGERLARGMGLSEVPLTRYGVKLERRPKNGKEDLALRCAESADMVYVEWNSLVIDPKSSLHWGYRLPYFRHSLAFNYSITASKPVTIYGYKVSEVNRAEMQYNANNDTYAASFLIAL